MGDRARAASVAIAAAAVSLLVLLVPAVTTFAGPAQATAGGLGIRLIEAPVDRRDDPRARSYIVDHVAPGTTITRAIQVDNGTDRQAGIDLYASAAEIRDEQFVPSAGRTANDVSSWTTVRPGHLDLAPGASARAEVTIAVPANAPAGERYGVVFAELPPPDPQAAVGIAVRAGIRIYLSVGAGGEPPTDFRLVSFTPGRSPDGRPSVAIHACNTGGRALDLTGDLRLSDGPGGTSAGPVPSASAVTLSPRECGDVRIDLDRKLPPGPWQATVALHSGTTERSATARITFPPVGGRSGPVPARSVTGTSKGRAALVAALAVLALAVALLLAAVWRRRRGGDEDDRRG